MAYEVEIVTPDSSQSPTSVVNAILYVKVRADGDSNVLSVHAEAYQGTQPTNPAVELSPVSGQSDMYDGTLDAWCSENEPYPTFRIYAKATFAVGASDPPIKADDDAGNFNGKCEDA